MHEFGMYLYVSRLQNNIGQEVTLAIIKLHSIFLYKSCTKAA